jgi:tripartite ATP-independent transporter DctM subunit
MSLVLIMVLAFFVFLVLGIPIVLALLASALTYIVLHGDVSFNLIPIKLFRSTDAFVFLSVPFFILAGKLMNATGLTGKLVHFSDTMVGRLRGGLAHVNIVVSMFFGGCTGTAISDTSAVGSILIPAMIKKGYKKDFSAAVTAASSTMGPIIPPSIAFILYGAASNVSIGDLFLAGIIPGLLVGFSQMGVVAYYANKRNYPKRETKISTKEFFQSFKEVSWGLALPIIILGGIISGVFTPTEAAVIAVFYSLFVGMLVYRNLTFRNLLAIMADAAVESGAVMVIVAAAALFGWVLAMEQIPVKLAQLITEVTTAPWQALILINIVLLVVGMFIDSAPAIILVTPILLPLFRALGLDPVQAGVLTCINLVTGLSTPPVGCCLFAASVISKESFEKISLAIIPFIIANLVVLMLVTYVPQITLFIPRTIFGH